VPSYHNDSFDDYETVFKTKKMQC